jgi:serine/threonine protein kinase
MAIQSGAVLNNRYEVLSKVGVGGMGAVWRGRDVLLDRDVAIKVMLNPDEAALTRFMREARVGAKLQHPGITTIHDVDFAGNEVFIVMEFLDGNDLGTVVANNQQGLKAARAVGYMIQACEALAAAHERGVIHRDLKPQNMFVVTGDRLKICDFGVAKIVSQRITSIGMGMGTPPYMAPEQFSDASSVDARADLYSLGCVLYALLTGLPPFLDQTLTPEEFFACVARVDPEPPRGAYPVPRELSALTMRMLAKRPEDRPASALEVAAELRRIDLAAAYAEPTPPASWPFYQKTATVQHPSEPVQDKKSQPEVPWWEQVARRPLS